MLSDPRSHGKAYTVKLQDEQRSELEIEGSGHYTQRSVHTHGSPGDTGMGKEAGKALAPFFRVR